MNVVQHFVYVYVYIYGHNSVTGTFLKYRITQNSASQTELKSWCQVYISTG